MVSLFTSGSLPELFCLLFKSCSDVMRSCFCRTSFSLTLTLGKGWSPISELSGLTRTDHSVPAGRSVTDSQITWCHAQEVEHKVLAVIMWTVGAAVRDVKDAGSVGLSAPRSFVLLLCTQSFMDPKTHCTAFLILNTKTQTERRRDFIHHKRWDQIK